MQEVAQTPVVGWLVALTGKHKGQDFRLREGKNIIGSEAECEIVLDRVDVRPATPLDRHHVRGDVGHAADDGQLGDGLVEGTALAPLGERVLLDGAEGARPATRGAGPLGRTGVDRGQPDSVVVGGDEAGGVDGQDVVL